MSKVYIGIDPGTKGGIAILTGVLNHIHPMPIWEGKIDTEKLARLLFENNGGEDVVIIVEDVHAIFGASAKSTFNFGWICAQIHEVVYSGFTEVSNVHYIQPKVWQKEVWIESDIVREPTKRVAKKTGLLIQKIDTKKTSFNACKRIFPLINVPTTPKSKVPHDGIIDALLIAEYGRRTYA